MSECLLRDLCEYQSRLGDIARIAEVSLMSSFSLIMCWEAIVGSN